MRVFINKWFMRFTRKEDIANASLLEAVKRLEAGEFNADLGGGVYKQRIARTGEGQSGGYRVLLCFRQGDRALFIYGFPKSARANITQSEKSDLKKIAAAFFSLTEEELSQKTKAGAFHEVQ